MHVNNLFLHEIALHPEHDSEDFRPPFFVSLENNRYIPPLGPAYVTGIMECISASQSALKKFISLSVERARVLPSFLFARCMYCCIVLIKLDVSTRSPNSEIGKIVDRSSLMTSQYIEKMLHHLKNVVGNDGKCVVGGKFLNILGKLFIWFRSVLQQSRGGPVARTSIEPGRAMSSEYKFDQAQPVSLIKEEPRDVEQDIKASMGNQKPSQSFVAPIPSWGTQQQHTNFFANMPKQPAPQTSISQNGQAPFRALPTFDYMKAYTAEAQSDGAFSQGTSTQPGASGATGAEVTPDNGLSAGHNSSSPMDYSSPEMVDMSGPMATYPMEVDTSIFNQLEGMAPFDLSQEMTNDWMVNGIDLAALQEITDVDWNSINASWTGFGPSQREQILDTEL